MKKHICTNFVLFIKTQRGLKIQKHYFSLNKHFGIKIFAFIFDFYHLFYMYIKFIYIYVCILYKHKFLSETQREIKIYWEMLLIK